MSDHTHISIQLSALADGELSPTEEAALRQQIDADPALASEFAQIQAVRSLLGQLPKSTLHASFAQDVAAQIRRKRFTARLTRVAAAAAIVITTTVIVLTSTNPTDTADTTDRNFAATTPAPSIESRLDDALAKTIDPAPATPAVTDPAAPPIRVAGKLGFDDKRYEKTAIGTGTEIAAADLSEAKDLDTERKRLLDALSAEPKPAPPEGAWSPRTKAPATPAPGSTPRGTASKSKAARSSKPEFFDPKPGEAIAVRPTKPTATTVGPAAPVEPVLPKPMDPIAVRSAEPKPVAPIAVAPMEPTDPTADVAVATKPVGPVVIASRPATETHFKGGAMKKSRHGGPDLSSLNVQPTETVNLYTDNLPREQKALETFFTSNKIAFANTQAGALGRNAPAGKAAPSKAVQTKNAAAEVDADGKFVEVEYVLTVDNRQLAALNGRLLPKRMFLNSNVSQLPEPTHNTLLVEADREFTRNAKPSTRSVTTARDAKANAQAMPYGTDTLRAQKEEQPKVAAKQETNNDLPATAGAVQSPGDIILAAGEKKQADGDKQDAAKPEAEVAGEMQAQAGRRVITNQSQAFSKHDLRQRALLRQVRLVVRYRRGFETLPRHQQSYIQTRNLAPSQLQNRQVDRVSNIANQSMQIEPAPSPPPPRPER